MQCAEAAGQLSEDAGRQSGHLPQRGCRCVLLCCVFSCAHRGRAVVCLPGLCEGTDHCSSAASRCTDTQKYKYNDDRDDFEATKGFVAARRHVAAPLTSIAAMMWALTAKVKGWTDSADTLLWEWDYHKPVQ